MLPSFLTKTVIRLRPGTKTLRGSEVQDWSDPERLEIRGCSVQPAGTLLSEDGRVLGLSDGATAYLPAAADVRAGDRIEYKGDVYEIDGAPRTWESATGELDNMMLSLKRYTG